jgi:hypothetical protein
MTPLRELQAQFAAALLAEDATGVAHEVVGDGLESGARIKAYWNHVFTSLTEALEATYPVVRRLVDPRFFGFAADSYIRRHPPVGPCLFEYGATLGDFLGSFPPCAGHPYLADVARLEWAVNVVLHAQDAEPLEPMALSQVAPADLGRLAFRTDPAAAWLRSPWPVDLIWRGNQPAADPGATVDLAAGGVRLEIRRRDDRVTIRRLEPAEFAFRAAVGAGEAVEAAADAAIALDPDFDLGAALRGLFGEALVIGLALRERAS